MATPRVKNEAEAQMEKAVREINAMTKEEGPADPGERFQFVSLSEQLADSIVQAYEQQLTTLQNMLEEAKLKADQIRAENKKRADELHAFTQRVRLFGESLLDAHRTFQDGQG